MRTSVLAALFLMLILSFRPIKENKICTHCDFARMYEPKVDLNPKQPKEYIHKDSLFIFQPVIDNIDEPKKYWYIQEFKMTYKDLHYCSDSTKLTLYLAGDSIKLWNVRPRISCKIDMWYRLSDDEQIMLSKYSINKVKIENRVTDNIYVYRMTDPSYFIKCYDMMK